MEAVSSHERKVENRAVNFFVAPSHKELLARKILRWGLFIKQGLNQKQMRDSHVRGAKFDLHPGWACLLLTLHFPGALSDPVMI